MLEVEHRDVVELLADVCIVLLDIDMLIKRDDVDLADDVTILAPCLGISHSAIPEPTVMYLSYGEQYPASTVYCSLNWSDMKKRSRR